VLPTYLDPGRELRQVVSRETASKEKRRHVSRETGTI
jgi:hypothetical protein